MHKRQFLVFMAIFMIFGGSARAQDTGICSTLVDRALSHIGNNCANMGLNTVCYGHNDLSAVFADDSMLEDPADRADLLPLASLQTMPFDSANEAWGISVLNIQANLPNTLPGQAVKMVLLGDVYIEDETEADRALLYLEESVAVDVQTDIADVFAEPIDFGVSSLSIVGHVSAGETLEADGLSSTGEWVRVTFSFATERGQSATAWVLREDLVEDVMLDTLPVIGPGSYTPMQAFYFSTGVGQADCNELPPSSILVQGPEAYEVTIRANGADINISSTVLLQTSSSNDMMSLTTISGFARVNPNSPEELIIPAGYSATVCLDGPYNLGVADNENDHVVGLGCDWSLAGGMTQDYLTSLQSLEQIPANLLNYEISVPQQICASGIGGVRCEYQYMNQRYSDELAALCANGMIDPDICDSIGKDIDVLVVEECLAVVEQVHTSVKNNCANLDWNRVCYGYQGMVASFSSAEDLLQPADRGSAVNFIAATNEGFDELLDKWGIFVMNTRADLPNTFTDGSVYSVFFGDGQIESHVATNAALILPETPVTVVVAVESAELFMAPDTFVLEDSSMIGAVKEGTTWEADVITEDGDWVRIVFEYETDFGHIQTTWIRREALVENVAIDELPVMKSDSYTPMQSLSFTTSAAVPKCGEAATSAQMAYLIVQSPTDTEISQTINGADVRINGTILVQSFPARRLIRVTTLSGIVRVQPGSSDELLIPAGYSAITCMDGPFNLGMDGLQNEYLAGTNCDWHLSGQLTEDAIAAFGADQIPGDLLNYPVYLPSLVCDEQGCDYQDTNPAYAERLVHLCEEEYLSESICRFVPD
jgi:hypothetical protein